MQLAVFLCRQIVLLMELDRRHQMQISLDSFIVIVANVVLYSIDQVFPGRKSYAVVLLALQDAPKALHWTVINAVCNSGHALLHVMFLQSCVELPACILESPVTMKQRMSVRFKSHCSVEGIHNQRIVIAVSDLESDNSTVIKIKNST